MHAVRCQLLEAQADAVGLPFWLARIPWPCPNDAYERVMAEADGQRPGRGVTAVAFGDLFLADIRRYREGSAGGHGPAPPLPPLGPADPRPGRGDDRFGPESHPHLRRSSGPFPRPSRAAISTGRCSATLPLGVDPCGENGEFHTFAWDGPGVPPPGASVAAARSWSATGFVFADLLPAGTAPAEGRRRPSREARRDPATRLAPRSWAVTALSAPRRRRSRGASPPSISRPTRCWSIILPPGRLVSVTRWADEKGTSNVVGRVPPGVHRFVKADLEQLVALRPDLVVVSEYTDADFLKLARAHGSARSTGCRGSRRFPA